LFTNGAASVLLLPWQAAEANAVKSPFNMACVGMMAVVEGGSDLTIVP